VFEVNFNELELRLKKGFGVDFMVTG
jgi:hypothetical protein